MRLSVRLVPLRAALLGLALLLPFAAAALAPPKGATEVATVEGITEYRLDNGLTVLMFPDSTKPTVTVNITYKVGSRHENYGETGMAHLLEHLLFKGTPTHGDIPGEMKKRGIGFNASTWLDRTNYFASFTADEGTLDWLLALEADRMRNSFVRRSDLDSEMTVVRNEMEAGENNPFQVLMTRIVSTAFLWHNYGNSTIGARADVEDMPIERLQAFYRDHYRPDNAVLLVAGRIDPATTLGKVVATFGPLPRPAQPLQPTYTREPVQDGEREVTVRRVGETSYVGAAYHIPAGIHPDAAPLEVLGEALGHTPTGRLHKALVEGKLATQVAAFGFSLAEPGVQLFFAEVPKGGDMAQLRARLLALIEGGQQKFTEEEIAAVRLRLAKEAEQTVDDANRLAMALSESIALGDWRLFFLQRDRIEKVTLADVERVAAAYFKPANRTFGQFIPTATPDRAEIAEAAPPAEQLKGYTGRAALAAGEAFDPSPANIDARTERGQLGNGTRYALLPKENRGDTVALQGVLRFGSEADVTGRSDGAGLVASMLLRGSKDLTREQISRRLDELKAQLSFNGGAQSVGFYASTKREHLPALMELIAQLLKSPSFPEAEFEQLRTQSITGIESQMTEPQAVAGNAMNRHFSPWPKGHPLYAKTFEESLATLRGLKLDDLRAFHRDFYGAGHGEIAVVGDFDPAAFKAQAETLFGGWTTPKKFVRIADPYVEFETVSRAAETPDKANAIILMRTDLPLSNSHPDYAALVAGNYVLGGGSLKSRLADRVRQKDGLSYSVASQFQADALDESGSLLFYAIAAPENVAKVEAAFREERARLLRDGVEADELKDAVDGLLKARQRNRGEDGALVGQLREGLYLQRTLAWSAELEARMAALTPPQVHDALKRNLELRPMSVFSAGDFAKVKDKAAAPAAPATPPSD
jgi:zinc protease